MVFVVAPGRYVKTQTNRRPSRNVGVTFGATTSDLYNIKRGLGSLGGVAPRGPRRAPDPILEIYQAFDFTATTNRPHPFPCRQTLPRTRQYWTPSPSARLPIPQIPSSDRRRPGPAPRPGTPDRGPGPAPRTGSAGPAPRAGRPDRPSGPAPGPVARTGPRDLRSPFPGPHGQI